MEKTFLRMKAKPSARHAYLEAELVTGLAHQIRAIRAQRGWTQVELAKKLGTTQAAVSRLEDPSYGRYSMQTLMDLAKIFDTGMQVRFVSFISMLQETFRPSAEAREVPAFEEESINVGFFSPSPPAGAQVYLQPVEGGESTTSSYLSIDFTPKITTAVLSVQGFDISNPKVPA